MSSISNQPNTAVIDSLTDKAAVNGPVGNAARGVGAPLDVPKGPDPASLLAQQVADLQGQLASLNKKVADYEDLDRTVKGAFSPSVADDQVIQNNMQKILKRYGWTDEQIAAQFAPEPKPARGQQQTPQPQKPDPMTMQAVGEVIRDRLRDHAQRVVESHPDIKAFHTYIAKRDGQEAADKIKATWVDMTFRDAMSAYGKKLDEIGRVDLTLLGETASAAVGRVAGQVRPLLGDPKNLGRVPNMGGGEDPLAEIADSKPVEAPQYKEGMSYGEVSDQMDKFIKDRLLRDAARTLASNQPSAI